MEVHRPTTPFGRRSLTLAHVATQMASKDRPIEKAVHKWTVFRDVCAAKARIGVSERALAVLDALLSFHPETALTGVGLIVFPSNAQLSLRAHGMAPATLRRHLSVLVDAGLIIRRDSPNGKRYARKGRGGEVELAFGFDLSPMVARAEEFETLAEEVRAEARALKLVRERISLCRRDISKMIETGVEAGVALRSDMSVASAWTDIRALYRNILARIPRTASHADLEPIGQELSMLAEELAIALEQHVKTQNMSANESQSERHKQNSNTDAFIELEPRLQEGRGVEVDVPLQASRPAQGLFPLGMVLDACPDLSDYASHGITTWRDFVATAFIVRPMLGISPSAWEDAKQVMGEIPASIVVACILQRAGTISSAGGYLRGLTRKSEQGEFSLGPMLMALIAGRGRTKKSA